MDWGYRLARNVAALKGSDHTLVSPARAHADIPHISSLDYVMEGLHLNHCQFSHLNKITCSPELTVSSMGVS